MANLRPALIVDDEPAVQRLMTRWAAAFGVDSDVAGTADEALDRVRVQSYEVAVIDVAMPGRDGLWLASELRTHHPDTGVVIATGHADRVQDICAGLSVADVLVKPIDRDRFLLAVDRGRTWHQWAVDPTKRQGRLSSELLDRLEALRGELDRRVSRRKREMEILTALGRERLPDVQAHSERVAHHALNIAEALGFDAGACRPAEDAARLHDVGKLVIPERLIMKSGPLTAEERLIMRQHVEMGASILASSHALQPLAPLVRASHEWFNGEGYPEKLAGTAIPLASRVIAVADAYDTMIHGRPYRGRIEPAAAGSELVRCAGVQFDPDVVSAFLCWPAQDHQVH